MIFPIISTDIVTLVEPRKAILYGEAIAKQTLRYRQRIIEDRQPEK
jgi:hypothetical protein